MAEREKREEAIAEAVRLVRETATAVLDVAITANKLCGFFLKFVRDKLND